MVRKLGIFIFCIFMISFVSSLDYNLKFINTESSYVGIDIDGDDNYTYSALFSDGTGSYKLNESAQLTIIESKENPIASTTLAIKELNGYVYAGKMNNGVSVYQINSTGGLDYKFNQVNEFNYRVMHFAPDDYGTCVYSTDDSGNIRVTQQNSSGYLHSIQNISMSYDGELMGGGYSNDWLYITGGTEGLAEFHRYSDCSMYYFSHEYIGDSSNDVWVDGLWIYSAHGDTGIIVYRSSVSTVNREFIISANGSTDYIWGDENYVYTNDGVNQTRVYKRESNNNLTLIDSYTLPSSSYLKGIWTRGNEIYVGGSEGITLFRNEFNLTTTNTSFENNSYVSGNNKIETDFIESASTISDQKLIYDGLVYPATLTTINSTLFHLSSDIINYENLTGTNTFYWNVTLDGVEYSSKTFEQTIHDINFSICDNVNNITYLSIGFQDEITLNSLNATIRTSTFEYYIDNSDAKKTYTFLTSENKTYYEFCFDPSNQNITVDSTINYYALNYPERTYGTTTTYSNDTTNLTLKLLEDSDGLYATLQFVDSITSIEISDVKVLIYDGTTFINELITDDSGTITIFLNPNILYSFQYSKSGYDSGTRNIRPTTTDTYTIKMAEGGAVVNNSIVNGLSYYHYPQEANLNNNETYTFGFYTTEGEETITETKFTLYDENNTIIISKSISGQGNISEAIFTGQNKTFRVVYEITGEEGGYFKYEIVYYITVIEVGDYSLKALSIFLNDIFPVSERTTLTRIIFLIMWFVCMMGAFTFGYNGSYNTREDYVQNTSREARGNTTSGLFFAFIITMLFTYFNLIPIDLGMGDWMTQNFLGVIILLPLSWQFIGSIFKHSRRTN